MSGQKSFTHVENEVVHEYRKNIAAASTVGEVKEYFARAVCALLGQASADAVRCRHEDVNLLPTHVPHYTLSDGLSAQPAFQAIWNGSDLPAILGRLVEPAVHRCVHLGKHEEKTNTNNYHHLR